MPDADPLAGAKAFLAKPSVVPRRAVDTSKDIDLPNDTGETDPRLVTYRARHASAKKPLARTAEQPTDLKSNIALRRSLGGR